MSIPSRSIPPTRLLLMSCRRPSDIRHTLASVGRTDEANLIGEVCVAADTLVPLLWNLDTTTDGDVVIDAGSAGRVPADNSADPFIAVCAPVSRLRSRFELALTRSRFRSGQRQSVACIISSMLAPSAWFSSVSRRSCSETRAPFGSSAFNGVVAAADATLRRDVAFDLTLLFVGVALLGFRDFAMEGVDIFRLRWFAATDLTLARPKAPQIARRAL